MKRIGLLSDTHGHLDDRILHHLDGMDEIWHAGDIGKLEVTDRLANIAPLRAVYGNIDDGPIRREFPLDQRFTIEGLHVWMTHIAGRPGRYYQRVGGLLREWPVPDVLICGHSHLCLVERDNRHGHLHMNPGAAGVQGFHKVRTLLRFQVNEGQLQEMEVVELGTRG